MKERIQKYGRFLSGMVMPNIGAFIAWGLITALFIPTGWLPNERFYALVGPMIIYLLPLLIGYMGGYNVWKFRGAIVGVIATMGVIVGADIPMFIGAMIAGPLGGYCIKKFDQQLEGKIPMGFEMLVNNFSAGIIGFVLALLGMVVINPVTVGITNALSVGVEFFVNHGLLPLVAILVEPGKVLFLNNAINHGIFTPLGIEQAAEVGRSIFFMIESNPGPGMGLLLAYMFFGKGTAKTTSAGAAIIHFFGGIHEIYFPFVLMKPKMILAPIAGSIVAIFILQMFNGGLVAAASPGSIFAQLLMTPRGAVAVNVIAIAVSLAVSFVVSAVLLKTSKDDDDMDLEESQQKMQEMKASAKGLDTATAEASDEEVSIKVTGNEKKIVFACDAGMGSSAMGATMLRNKLKTAGFEDITVINASVSEIPPDTDIIVTHRELEERARSNHATAKLVLITNFMGAPEYDTLVAELVEARK